MKCRKSLTRLLCVLVGIAALGFAVSAQAECGGKCNKDGRACVSTARTASLSCKLACRSAKPNDLRPCVHRCIDTFAGAKEACHDARTSCRDACNPDNPTPCPATCGKALGECMRDVAGAHRTCVGGCASAADRPACIGHCSATHSAGSDACRATFRHCLDRCDGSPSGAFID